LLIAAVGALLFSLPLAGQGNFGRILGTVTDQTGGVISGAVVSVIDKDRGVARTLATDVAGEYNAPTLIPGTYSVRVEAKGFKTTERQNVVLEVGKEVRVDLTVQPGEQVQTVTVTEAVPLVETTNATLGGTLNNADISDLPLNGRNFQYLMSLRPGVMTQPGGGPWTQSTNNIRPDESAWMVDGVLNASFFDARPVTGSGSFITDGATILPIDAIQEFNMEENPKAEYGWKPGAVVNVGIRSGTNSLHGAAYSFGRDASFDTRNVFNPAPKPQLPLELKQFGAVVGGPIQKEKLFFFAGYEGLRDLLGNAYSLNVPETASGGGSQNSMVDAVLALQKAGVAVSPVSLAIMGCPSAPLTAASTCTGGLIQNLTAANATSTSYLSTFPNSNTSDNGIAKIDYRINSKHMLNGLFWVGNYSGIGEDHAMVNAAFLDTVQIRNWDSVVNWIWTPSSTVVNEVRFGYSRDFNETDPVDVNVVADGKNYPINTGLSGFPNMYISGFFNSTNSSLGSWRNRPGTNGPNPFYDIQESVSYLKGKHAFKFGGEYGNIEVLSFGHDTRGRFDFNGGSIKALKDCGGASCPLEDFFAGAPSRSQQLLGDAHRTLKWYDVAGFVQDDWRVTQKVIVNLGLRYSYTSPIKEVNNLLGSFDPTLGIVQQGQASVGNTLWKPDYKDFSPRLGFAWDVSGKGTTVVRGGGSIIYSSFVVASFATGAAGPNNFTGGSLAAVPTAGCTTAVAPGVPCPATYGGTISLGAIQYAAVNWNAPPGNSGVFPAGVFSCAAKACNIVAADPNLKTPYITNWNLSVTRAFTNNLSLEVGYVGNRGTNLTGFSDINQKDLVTGVRPYSNYSYLGFINQVTNGRVANYNSLQTTLTQRVSHGLNFTAGYTYGHGLDDGSANRFGPTPQDSRNTRAEYASSDFDVRHRLTLTTGYALPGKKGFAQILEGWKINSIVSVQSAQPWEIADTGNNFSGTSENQDRWDFCGGTTANCGTYGNPSDFKSGANSIPYCTGFPATVSCTSQSAIDHSVYIFPNSAAMGAQCAAVAPNAGTLAKGGCYIDGNSVMVPPTPGTFGTMGRNIFRDNGFKNWDLSLFKTFTFKERFSAQFRVEFFNVLNHPTISNPSGANNGSHGGDDPSSTGTLGAGTATPDFATGNPIIGSGDSRLMQLGLKLTF
jgi:hypothetical protein